MILLAAAPSELLRSASIFITISEYLLVRQWFALRTRGPRIRKLPPRYISVTRANVPCRRPLMPSAVPLLFYSCSLLLCSCSVLRPQVLCDLISSSLNWCEIESDARPAPSANIARVSFLIILIADDTCALLDTPRIALFNYLISLSLFDAFNFARLTRMLLLPHFGSKINFVLYEVPFHPRLSFSMSYE